MKHRSLFQRYLVVLVSVTAGVLLTFAVAPWFRARAPTIPLTLAVIVSAWYGGLGPGLFATIFSFLAVDFFFVSPNYSFFPIKTEDFVLLGLYAAVSVTVSVLTGRLYNAREDLQAAQAQSLADLEAVTRLQEVGNHCILARNNVGHALDEVLAAAIAFTKADKGNIQLFDPGSGALEIATSRGFEEPFLRFFASVRDEHSACSAAMKRAERVIVEDVGASEIFVGQPSLKVLLDAGVRAVQSTPLLSSGGNVLGMISTHFSAPHRPGDRELRLVDLLARQTADYLERRKAEEALHHAAEFDAAALKSLGEGLYTIDTNDLVTSMNPAAEELFGWSFVELRGKKMHDMTHHHYRDGRPFPSSECAGFRIMTHGRGLKNHEDVFIRKNGTFFDVVYSIAPTRDNLGRITGLVVAFSDTTERKRAEEQHQELQFKEQALASEKALREKDAELARILRALSLGELATSIAPEVNQPLTALVANAQAAIRWLNAAPPKMDEVKQSLDLVVLDGNRASELIHHIRDFLKKDGAPKESLNINDVIHDAVALANTELLKRKIVIRMELSAGLPLVEGDRIELQQVILNLAMNAAEAMARGSVPRELLMKSGLAKPQQVIVTIRDSGIGMRTEDLLKMFDPFFTTKTSGIGIGLSISRSIVEAHGGRMWAQANDGPGLTVQFTLPAESDGAKLSASGDGPYRPHQNKPV